MECLFGIAYKNYLDGLGDDVKSSIQRKIIALDFLATTDKETQLDVFSSGAFNSICMGYMKKSLENIGIDKDTADAGLSELYHLLDTMSAYEAERYYMGK